MIIIAQVINIKRDKRLAETVSRILMCQTATMKEMDETPSGY